MSLRRLPLTAQALDIGGGSRFAPLPVALAALPELRSVVLPRGVLASLDHAAALAALAARGRGSSSGGGGGGHAQLELVCVREG